MAITDEMLNELLKEYHKPEDLLGKDGIFKQLQKRLLEKALGAEMTAHLGYEKHERTGGKSGNSRNGTSAKTIQGEFGKVAIEVPRDREGEFDPQIIGKGQRRFEGFDQAIISLYARGLTTREIEGHLLEIYGVEVSAGLISQVTEAVMGDVKAWQSRPLEEVYPIVYFDALWGKVRENGQVGKVAVYLALGIKMDGNKEVLGMWSAASEGAKFWLHVLTELKNRGVKDIFIGCVDGIKGFPEAMEVVFPQTKMQLCLVHMVRHSLSYVGWKDRKAVATDLKKIYRAATAAEAEVELAAFEEKWGRKFPSIGKSWRSHWAELVMFMSYPAEIRKAIYTTNAIESLNRSLRKISKNRGLFPNQESMFKLYYLALERIAKKWTMPIRNWNEALNRLVMEFGNRVPPME
jgi:putative transposase